MPETEEGDHRIISLAIKSNNQVLTTLWRTMSSRDALVNVSAEGLKQVQITGCMRPYQTCVSKIIYAFKIVLV